MVFPESEDYTPQPSHKNIGSICNTDSYHMNANHTQFYSFGILAFSHSVIHIHLIREGTN